MSLPKIAQALASKGRHGDTMLLHVSPLELQGLASLMPTGKLTRNPETGLPEAFFFLPFLASLFGGAAAAAPAAAAAVPAATAALGTAATAAPIATGIASALPTMQGLTAAGTAAAHGLAAGPTMGGLVGAGKALGTAASTLAPAAAAAPATAAPAAAGAAGAAPAVSSTLTQAGPIAGGAGLGLQAAGTGPIGGAGGGIGGLLKGGLNSNMLMPALMAGSQLFGSMGGGGKKKEKDEGPSDEEVANMDYEGGDPVFPEDDYEGGIDDEWDYFPKYNNGGIVALAEGGPVDLQAQMPQDMSFPQNGVPATPGLSGEMAGIESLPASPFPTSQIGSPQAETTDGEQELIAQTVEAIQGKSPDPQPILAAFIQTFGEAALQDLVQRVQGTAGDGTSDSIPAMINGTQPAALSEGEYVIPADVVSGMGNGSTGAGARRLDDMVGKVREHKTGDRSQPSGIQSLMG